jgi:hypothetical protein
MPNPPRTALALIAVVVAVGVLAGVWVLGMEQDCVKRWERSSFTFEWREYQCYILAGSNWIPEQNIRVPVRQPVESSDAATAP